MRLIDADKLAEDIYRAWTLWEKKGEDCYLFAEVITPMLIGQPTVDAEPIVRCKDCKHRFLEIIEGKKVFSCLYRMGTLDLNGYCDCGAKMDEVAE